MLAARGRVIVGDRVTALYPSVLRYLFGPARVRAFLYRRRVPHLVRRLAPDAVILNTAEPAPYSELLRDLAHPVKLGLVHNPRRERLGDSDRDPTTLLFCLHEYNFHRLRGELLVDGYLSPFFRYSERLSRPSSDAAIELAVQGIISFSRRDYLSLIDVARRLMARSPRPRVVFNILGDSSIRDGPRLRHLVMQHGLEPYFKLHRWLSDHEFFQQLQRAQYLLPLIAPHTGPYASGAKVSAAFGHSGAYGIPLLVQMQVAEGWGVPRDACVTYRDSTDLTDILAGRLVDHDVPAERYQSWIDAAIQRNRAHLRQLNAAHPALAPFRPREV